MKRQLRVPLALLWFCLVPSTVLANGIAPILNLFHKETFIPATVVTLVIIFVESGLLRWRVKQVPFGGALWRSGALNVASGAVGSLVLLGNARTPFFFWDTMSLVLPLFFITLATEIPLLHFLYKRVPLTWERTFRLGFGINLASYAAVFVVQIGLVFALILGGGSLDAKELERRDLELLNRASGLIYTTEESVQFEHHLRFFDTQTGEWHSLVNCPPLNPRTWDVQGGRCAFIPRTSASVRPGNLVVASLPDFTVVQEVSQTSFADRTSYDWPGIRDLEISPDGSKLAVLVHVADAVAYRDEYSYYDLDSKCRLIVLDILSGKEIARASRWASDKGLCWFPDSSKVIFPSFKDESVYETTKSEVRGTMSRGIGFDENDRFSRALFWFEIDSGEVEHFSDGYLPSLSEQSHRILVRTRDRVRMLDLGGKERGEINIARLRPGSRVVPSPRGDCVLVAIQSRNPFGAGGHLKVVDSRDMARRHVLDKDLFVRYEWVSREEELPNQRIEPD